VLNTRSTSSNTSVGLGLTGSDNETELLETKTWAFEFTSRRRLDEEIRR
jgi:hypothetical protein